MVKAKPNVPKFFNQCLACRVLRRVHFAPGASAPRSIPDLMAWVGTGTDVTLRHDARGRFRWVLSTRYVCSRCEARHAAAEATARARQSRIEAEVRRVVHAAIAAHHGAVDVRALLPFAFHHCAGEGADRKAACMLAVDPVFLRDGAAAGWWQYDAHHQIVATVGTVTLRADDTDACDESSVH